MDDDDDTLLCSTCNSGGTFLTPPSPFLFLIRTNLFCFPSFNAISFSEQRRLIVALLVVQHVAASLALELELVLDDVSRTNLLQELN